jgi:hypothetical protein
VTKGVMETPDIIQDHCAVEYCEEESSHPVQRQKIWHISHFCWEFHRKTGHIMKVLLEV